MSKSGWKDWVPIYSTRFGPPDVYPGVGVGVIWPDVIDSRGTRDMVIRSVNLLGPHLDDADRMAAFKAIAGMDADTFGVVMDWFREHGFVGM